MDAANLTRTISRYFATFGRKPDAEILEAYARALRCLDDQQLARAFQAAIERGGAHPLSAAELLQLGRQGPDDADARALLAFEELERALDANKPSLMSPATAAVARSLGGFDVLWRTPIDEFNRWKRKDFLEAYATLVRTKPERLEALAAPNSELAVAFKKLPTRAEPAQLERQNRQAVKQHQPEQNTQTEQ